MKYLSSIVLLLALSLSLTAQDETRRIGGFELGAGVNFFGPKAHMSELMTFHAFDAGIVNWIYLREQEYPFNRPSGLSFEMSYSRILKDQRSELGALFHFSRFSKVHGYSEISKELDVVFSSMSLTPFYRFGLNDFLELQGGPTLLLNQGKKTSIYDENVDETMDRYWRISAGLTAGLNIHLWDGMETYGKLGLHYTIAVPSSMGPFSAAYGFNELDTIPKDSYNFSHLNLMFILGFHHWHFKSL